MQRPRASVELATRRANLEMEVEEPILGVAHAAVQPGGDEVTDLVAIHNEVVVGRARLVPGDKYVGVDDLTYLAISARDGDPAAMEDFVRACQADVWRLCAFLGGRDRAEDLCQDSFVRIIGALPAFRVESSARTWMLSITRRACADDVRRRQRHRGLHQRLDALRRDEPSVLGSTAEVDDLIRRLDPDRRDAFVLTQLLGLSYEQAAEVCGCPVGTIRSRVSRARTDLLAASEQGMELSRLINP